MQYRGKIAWMGLLLAALAAFDRAGDRRVVVKAGDLVRIPAGTPHQAIVLGNEPMRAVISYSSGDRQVVDLEQGR